MKKIMTDLFKLEELTPKEKNNYEFTPIYFIITIINFIGSILVLPFAYYLYKTTSVADHVLTILLPFIGIVIFAVVAENISRWSYSNTVESVLLRILQLLMNSFILFVAYINFRPNMVIFIAITFITTLFACMRSHYSKLGTAILKIAIGILTLIAIF